MPSRQRTKIPPTRSGRRQRRQTETREKLYRTAMDLFAMHGFIETTTEDITEAADVGQGTFFNYFPTKSHVLVMLSEKQMEKFMAALGDVEEGKLSIREILRKLMHTIAQEPGRSQALGRSLLSALVSHGDVRKIMEETLARGRQGLAKICMVGQERGEIRTDRRAADLAMTFQRGTLGALLLWAIQTSSDLNSRLEKAFEDFWMIAGVKSK